MDDIDCRFAVLLRQRNGRECVQLWWLLPLAVLPQELLRSRPLVLRSRADLLRSRAGLCSDVRRSRGFVLQQRLWLQEQLLAPLQGSLLQAQVLQDQVLQAEMLQDPLLQAQLLRSGPDLLRSGCSDLLRSRTGLRSDLRCSHGCCLQLVVDCV